MYNRLLKTGEETARHFGSVNFLKTDMPMRPVQSILGNSGHNLK